MDIDIIVSAINGQPRYLKMIPNKIRYGSRQNILLFTMKTPLQNSNHSKHIPTIIQLKTTTTKKSNKIFKLKTNHTITNKTSFRTATFSRLTLTFATCMFSRPRQIRSFFHIRITRTWRWIAAHRPPIHAKPIRAVSQRLNLIAFLPDLFSWVRGYRDEAEAIFRCRWCYIA